MVPKRKNSRGRKPARERRLSIRAERRDQPDLARIAGAVVALAMAQAEKEAQAQAEAAKDATNEGAGRDA